MDLTDYRNGLKMFLKDYQDLNRLLNFEVESAPEKLDLYVNMALGFLNSVPPRSAIFSISDFPVPALLIHQATIECLISNSILQARNDLTYNNGGISVKVADAQRYIVPLKMLTDQTDMGIQMLSKLKVSINIENCWGGVNSPYQFIAGYPYLIRPYNGLA